jgi:hypothetical protein
MAYLVMDNHGPHNTPDNVREMHKLGIQVIGLPPHSSHFLQPLDGTVFGAFKKAYRLTRSPATRPKIEEKVIRVLHAWHNSAHIQTIYNGWKAGGIRVRGALSYLAVPELNAVKIARIIHENCSDAPANPATSAPD